MSETTWNMLRDLLLSGYDDLGRRLTRKLGSAELAREALQETFLRLERGGELAPVAQPKAYLFRIAFNIARDRRRAEQRRLSPDEIGALLEVPDEAPTPDRAAEARSDVHALHQALIELPARRREIFLAAWVEEAPRPEIARRFGISLSTLKTELRLAREHCAVRLARNPNESDPEGPRESSK